jgi:hypothetical protein
MFYVRFHNKALEILVIMFSSRTLLDLLSHKTFSACFHTSSPSVLTYFTMASNHFEPIPVAFASQTTEHQRDQRTFSFEPPASSGSKKIQLQVGFQPCDYSVVCGRGKQSFNHAGNRRFRILASMFIETYSQADNKVAKSAIVSKILVVIRQAGGHFCKYKRDTDTWFEVEDHCAREKVSALLRDLLHTQYRSSAKAKLGRRQNTVRKQKQHENSQSGLKQVEGTEDSDDSSTKQVEGTDESDDCSTTSSCWGISTKSLGFEYWLEESDDFFDIDVF